MNEIKVTLTREELRDLWFACCTAEEDANKRGHLYTAKDLGKLKEKLYNILKYL